MLNKYYVVMSLGVMYSVYHLMHNYTPRNKLVVIMLDGFRYDYVGNKFPEDLPGFSRLWQNGVRAHYMKPMFPGAAYPEWTTLSTGLWAESHGVVGDYMVDALEGDAFQISDPNSTLNSKWWVAEPIWTTATKADVRVGVLHWSRCDVPFDNVTVEHCQPFTHFKGSNTSLAESLETTLNMLEGSVGLVQVYDSHVAEVNTKFGPESQERIAAVKAVDDALLKFLEALDAAGMTEQVNVLVLSGHGSTSTTPEAVQPVELDDFLLTEYVTSVTGDGGASASVNVRPGFIDQVYDRLEPMPGMSVFRRSDIPDSLHFKGAEHAPDILVTATNGTYIMKSYSTVQIPPREDSNVNFGTHGYMPCLNKDMRGIFFASGPDFKQGYEVPPLRMVDVYPLLTHLLQVEPNENNGSWSSISTILRTSTVTKNSFTYTTLRSSMASHFSFNYTQLNTKFMRPPLFTNFTDALRNFSNDSAIDYDFQNLIDFEHDNKTRTFQEYRNHLFELLRHAGNANHSKISNDINIGSDLENETQTVTEEISNISHIHTTDADPAITEAETDVTAESGSLATTIESDEEFDQGNHVITESDHIINFESAEHVDEDPRNNSFYSWLGLDTDTSKGTSFTAGVIFTFVYSIKILILG